MKFSMIFLMIKFPFLEDGIKPNLWLSNLWVIYKYFRGSIIFDFKIKLLIRFTFYNFVIMKILIELLIKHFIDFRDNLIAFNPLIHWWFQRYQTIEQYLVFEFVGHGWIRVEFFFTKCLVNSPYFTILFNNIKII